MIRRRGFIVGLALATLFPAAARAVIVLGSQGNNFITPSDSSTLPPVSINGSNVYDYEGSIFNFLGTPVSPTTMVTAAHIGGSIGSTAYFTYANGTATTTTYTMQEVATDNDLAVWQIVPTIGATTFSLYAPIFTSEPAAGAPLVVMGNGTARGAATTGGWQWGAPESISTGASSNTTSWGVNTVAQAGFTPSGSTATYLLYNFNNNGNANEAIVSDGDSGGGVFVEDLTTGTYKLAGITYGVSLVSQQPNPSNDPSLYYDAALYDATGYYDGATLIDTANGYPDPFPMTSYATDIAASATFLTQYLPEPATVSLGILAAAMAALRRRRHA